MERKISISGEKSVLESVHEKLLNTGLFDNSKIEGGKILFELDEEDESTLEEVVGSIEYFVGKKLSGEIFIEEA